MDKQKEIATLRSLKGDTYFAQFFKEHDIEQMCENIKNDFPIEMDCQFNEKARLAAQEINRAKVEAAEDLEDMVANFIKLNGAAFSPDFYHYCVQHVGRLFIIKCKHEFGYPLNDMEIDHLIKIADKHLNPENYSSNQQ